MIILWLDILNDMKRRSGKTTEQISDESGIPKGTLNKLFAGQTKDPQHSTIYAVVHSLGYTVDDLAPTEKAPVTEMASEALKAEYVELLEDLLVAKGYMKKGEDISSKDAAFLIALLDLIDAHFYNGR